MLPLLLQLSTALAADAPAPAALVLQVLDELPADAQLHLLHWDGRRVWLSGEGLTVLTEDGRTPGTSWPTPRERSLRLDILASPTFSTPQMSRQDAFVMGLAAPELPVETTSPVLLQAADVWLDEPDYAAGLVHVRGLADSTRALKRFERVAALSPCLADSQVRPHELERLPIAFTLTARSLGDLRSEACAPKLDAIGAAESATLQVDGSWADIWAALSTSEDAPVDTFTIRSTGDALQLELTRFAHGGATSGKDEKALAQHEGTPTEDLLAEAGKLPPMPVDTLGYDMLGADAPRTGTVEELQSALVEDHRHLLHDALSVLDSTMVDLQAIQLQQIRQSHRQIVELVFELRLAGTQAQIEANLDELSIPGVELRQQRPGESTLAAVEGTPEGTDTVDAELVISVPVMGGAPRSPTWTARELPSDAPPNPFARGPGWAAKKTEIDTMIAKQEAVRRPKTWQIEYLGHVGTALPRGLVRLPDGTVHVVRQGDPLGDAWAPVLHLGDTGLQLRLDYTLLDGSDVRREVELPAPAHPPEEAPTPSAQLATLAPEALAELRARFDEGELLDIDVADVPLPELVALLAGGGIDLRIEESAMADLPRLSMQATQRPAGELLTQLQVVLVSHELVFVDTDSGLLLRADADAAADLRAALFTGGTLPLADLPAGPLAAAPPRGVRVHVSGASPAQLMQLMQLSYVATSGGESVHLSSEELTSAQLLGALDARLQPTGQQLVVAPDLSSVMVVAK